MHHQHQHHLHHPPPRGWIGRCCGAGRASTLLARSSSLSSQRLNNVASLGDKNNTTKPPPLPLHRVVTRRWAVAAWDEDERTGMETMTTTTSSQWSSSSSGVELVFHPHATQRSITLRYVPFGLAVPFRSELNWSDRDGSSLHSPRGGFRLQPSVGRSVCLSVCLPSTVAYSHCKWIL